MDENILPEPGMKRVQNLPLNGPVGLFKSGCYPESYPKQKAGTQVSGFPVLTL